MDRSDLPVYDESYEPQTKHKVGLTVFVRNLTGVGEEDMEVYLNKLSGKFANADYFGKITSEYVRLEHDEADCPAEDVDPFDLPSSKSYTEAMLELYNLPDASE